jgi:hypothetical protein
VSMAGFLFTTAMSSGSAPTQSVSASDTVERRVLS